MDDPVSSLTAVVDRLCETDPALLSDPESVVGLQRQLERLEAVVARADAAFDVSDAWQSDGAYSAAAWISTRCRQPRAHAQRRVHAGNKLRDMPATESAWLAGDMSSAHVRLLGQACTTRTAEVFARDEELLCEHARKLPFHQWVNVLKYWRYRADPDGAEDAAAMLAEGRRFRHSESLDGAWFSDGVFDPVGGAVFNKTWREITDELFREEWAEAKERLGREPTGSDLRRTASQRQADAVVEMARRARSVPQGARMPEPLFTVLVDYETFGGMFSQLANGTMVTPGRLVPYLTDGWVERVVFDGPSRVIDVGVRRRIFDGATRRAVEVIGQECFHETCDIPAEDCQIDHIQPWAAGGPTTQDNGRPACPFHNRNRHRPRPPPPQQE